MTNTLGNFGPACVNSGAVMLQRGYEGNWLGGTFSKAVFLGNGLIAIVAGLLGHALVEIFKLGPVSPFDAAALVLIGGGVYIAITWTENYGDSADKVPFHTSLVNAGKTIWEGERLLHTHVLLNCRHTSGELQTYFRQQVAWHTPC